MSIKTQKILRFIPVLNFIVMFIWIGAYRKNETKKARFNISLKIFGGTVIIQLTRIMIVYYLGVSETIYLILLYVSYYLTFLWCANVAIKDQEKFLLEKKLKK